MTEAIQLASQPLSRGRPTKFTPERIQQISNLVERGKSRDEIAEIIGVTTGTLQSTCSKLGISLRRPTFDIGLRPRPRSSFHKSASQHQPSPCREITTSEPVKEPQPVADGTSKADGAAGPPPGAARQRSSDPASAVFAIRMKYKDNEQSTGLPLDQAMIKQLALEAEIRGMRMGELAAALILAIIKKDLFQLVLEQHSPDE